jgi:hypothetical protein
MLVYFQKERQIFIPLQIYQSMAQFCYVTACVDKQENYLTTHIYLAAQTNITNVNIQQLLVFRSLGHD